MTNQPWQAMQEALGRAAQAQREELAAQRRSMEWRRWQPTAARPSPVDFGPREEIEDTPVVGPAHYAPSVGLPSDYTGILTQTHFLDRLIDHDAFEAEMAEVDEEIRNYWNRDE